MKFENMRAERLPDFLSSSTLSLLLDTKAISIPEKNAEKIKEMTITVRLST